eukprot:tig00021319_g20240.t1
MAADAQEPATPSKRRRPGNDETGQSPALFLETDAAPPPFAPSSRGFQFLPTCTSSDPMEVIEVDAGGTIFTSTRGTLCSVPGSRLAAVVAGKVASPRHNSRIFLDVDPGHFRIVLNWLRYPCPLDKWELEPDRSVLRTFAALGLSLEGYGMASSAPRPLTARQSASSASPSTPSPEPALDATVCVIGGRNRENIFASIEMYKESAGFWKNAAPTLAVSREGHASVAVGPKVYTLCGSRRMRGSSSPDAFLSSVECYDCSSHQWLSVPPLATPRYGLAAAALGTTIFAMGGWNGREVTDSVEIFDEGSQSWRAGPSLLEPSAGLGAVALGGRVWAAGGGHRGRPTSDTVQFFDPEKAKWLGGAPMQVPRASHGLVAHENCLYSFGGLSGDAESAVTEFLDVRVGQWQFLGRLALARRCLQGAVIAGRLMAIAGYDGQSYLDCCELFDVPAGKWRKGAPLCDARGAFSAVTLVA